MSEDLAAHPGARMPHAEFVAIVALLMALNAMSIDVILPALQQMGESLSVADENTRQLPITAYIAFFGLSQLVYGTISDHFGRRPVLLAGLAIYVISSFGAALAGDFTTLLVMRGIQGIGAGATRVIAISVVRDTYGGRKMASVMSLAMMVFMVVPILAPMGGQGVLLIAGWRAILAVIALFGLVMTVWCFLRLPETLADENRRPLKVRPVLDAFRIVVTNSVASGYAIGSGLVFGCMLGFLNSAQQIYQQTYGIGVLFPLLFSASAVFIAIGSFTNSRLVERLGMRLLSHAALLVFTAVSALLCLIAVIDQGHVPLWVFFGCMLVTFSTLAFMGTNFNALALDPLGHVAGTASSVVSSLQTILGGVLGAIIGLAYDGTVFPLTLGFLILSLFSFGIIVLTERNRLFGRLDSKVAHPNPSLDGP
jgi:DHA1 family bicyclomycin/chloramphenicol resistance-like MFS transporter